MIADVVEERLRCETAMRLDRGRHLQKLTRILDHLDSLFPCLGNDPYDVQKMIEPFVQALILLRDPGNHSDGAFLKFTAHTIMEVLDKHVPNPLTWMIELQSLLNERTVNKIAEWLCLYRILGHPHLDAYHAAAKVRKHIIGQKVSDFEVVRRYYASFCQIYISSYVQKHGGV